MTVIAEETLERARAAQVPWARLQMRERIARLQRLRHELATRMDELVDVLQQELGKPPMDSLAGDLMVTLEQMLFYEKHAVKLLQSRRVQGSWIFFRGTKTREVYEPHGVALVIAPWNYPVQLSLLPAVTALFAGNAVVCKCSEHCSRTSALLQEIVSRALPGDVMQISWGGPHEAQQLLEARPDFVFFTGSSAAGRKVAARAGELMIPCAMELGGKDAALVFASCNLERAVNGLVYGAFSNSGQVCVGTKRIYVEEALYQRFTEAFKAKMSELRMGVDIGPVRVEPLRERYSEHLQDARRRGAAVAGSDAEEVGPHVLEGLPDEAMFLREEAFGPMVAIAPFKSEQDAVGQANSSQFGLSASVWTGDAEQADRVARSLRTGSCVVNDVLRGVGHPAAAFGGVGESGFGRYHGAEGLRTFSRIKTIMTATTKSSTQINWFPFSTRTYQQLRALLRFRHGRGGSAKRAMELVGAIRSSSK